MAEIAEIRAAHDMSPVLAGFVGAGVLVVAVVVLVFLWTFCQRRYHRMSGNYKLHGIHSEHSDPSTDPPYKFIHMLKGISIYPETLSSSKRIVRLARRPGWRRERDGDQVRNGRGPGVLLVDGADAAECGQGEAAHLQMTGLGGEEEAPRLERDLPVRADYCLESSSASSSSENSSAAASKLATPFTPAEEPNLGALSLAVDYNFPKKALVVTILEARGLPAMDERAGSSDPYVKMTILPEKKHRVKTRVLRKTLEPVFDETFTFYAVPYSSLPELTLHFLVLSFDRFSRDDVIGEVVVPLAGVDPSTGKVLITQQICKRSMQCISRGELLVSLSYQPVSHRLSVVVLKAKHLPKMDITGLSGNPYVKVNVFYGRKRIAKKKTHVKKCTLNPVFNESFIYDVPAELLPDISVEFLVIDFDRTTKNEVVGRLVVGMHSPCPSGAAHWQEVCDNPRRQISKWHNLSEY
ncbi:synaptotagmin-11b [Denticeps clupeoides]|uniref:C2 domain-containing protein n=1 Tax=Denticeps clupeoides TaxID=299321 RepID=A0AAY4CY23_9TELE|nr:synaptotagmin-11-like [Denticeps clupeoides]